MICILRSKVNFKGCSWSIPSLSEIILYFFMSRFLTLFNFLKLWPYSFHLAWPKTPQLNGENIRQQSYLQAHQVYLAGNSSHSFFMHRLLCFNMHDKIHLRLLIETLIVQKMKDFVPNKCLTLNHNFLLQNNLCHIGGFHLYFTEVAFSNQF